MPYIENNSKKMAAVELAEQAIQEEIDSIRLKPWADVVLPTLQKRGYAIGMISNIAKAYISKVQELAPIQFDHMLFSCERGMKKTKNNHDIYQLAHTKSNSRKKEIVMIGDHETNDYDVATSYGIHAIHMDRKQKNTKQNRVHTISELLKLFPQKST